MFQRARDGHASESSLAHLLAYAGALEGEVDRLRRHQRVVRHELREALGHLLRPGGPSAAEAARCAERLADLVCRLRELPKSPVSYDHVAVIAVRPLAEQVFREHQEVQGAEGVALQLELESEHVEWFPTRLRHILDNLLSNALRYCDPTKAERWVRLCLRVSPEAYELRVSDNGTGLSEGERDRAFDLLSRALPPRGGGLGVGLAVVKTLVEQSGGSLTVDAGEGQGTSFVAVLPRYEVDDFLV